MNACDSIACALLGCKSSDLEYYFGEFVFSGVLFDAVESIASEGGKFTIQGLWERCADISFRNYFSGSIKGCAMFDIEADDGYILVPFEESGKLPDFEGSARNFRDLFHVRIQIA